MGLLWELGLAARWQPTARPKFPELPQLRFLHGVKIWNNFKWMRFCSRRWALRRHFTRRDSSSTLHKVPHNNSSRNLAHKVPSSIEAKVLMRVRHHWHTLKKLYQPFVHRGTKFLLNSKMAITTGNYSFPMIYSIFSKSLDSWRMVMRPFYLSGIK